MRGTRTLRPVLASCFILLVASQSHAIDLFVNAAAPPGGSGLGSWCNATRFLQDALEIAVEEDRILIAEGDYYVGDGLPGTPNRDSTFLLDKRLFIEGGWHVPDCTQPAIRNVSVYRTRLLGDIDKDDGTEAQVAAGFAAQTYTNYDDNAYSVIKCTGPTAALGTISGVTVQGGNANGGTLANPDKGNGGGIWGGDSTPTILSCTIQYCRAKNSVMSGGDVLDGFGGGIYVRNGGTLTVRDTRFFRNHAPDGGGLGRRPTIYSADPQTHVKLFGCTFTQCAALAPPHGRAGGCLLDRGTGKIDVVNCRFEGCTASTVPGGGGGLTIGLPAPCEICTIGPTQCFECTEECIVGGQPCTTMACSTCPVRVALTNCVFVGCDGRDAGGGGGCRINRKAVLTNCTFANCETDGASGGGGLLVSHAAHARLNGCVFWGNVGTASGLSLLQQQIGTGSGGIYTAEECDIQGCSCPDGVGNISSSPLFLVTPSKGPDNLWGTADDDYGDLRVASGSPCIDTALNNLLPEDEADLDRDGVTVTVGMTAGETLPSDHRYRKRIKKGSSTGTVTVDMGAMEHGCDADFNGDFLVNGLDLAVVIGGWTSATTYSPCPNMVEHDLDADCQINGDDLAILLSAWGTCAPPAGSGGAGAGQPFAAGGESSSPQDELYEQFMLWLATGDWAAFVQWWQETFGG